MTYHSPTLKRIVGGQLCAGCGACSAAAPAKIDMALDGAGFARPVQKSLLTGAEEEKITAGCPSVALTQNAAARPDDPLWGPYKSVYSGHATNERLRHHASSGGGLSALLTHLVESGAVDFVVQAGADTARPLGNATAVSKSSEDIYEAAGSRYAPSSPLAGLDAHLKAGRPFAFVGKPCDVAALRKLALIDARIDALVPYMISFFCAGTPSLKGAEEIVTAMGAAPNEVAAFRYRGDGWPGQARAILKDGAEHTMSYHDSWGKILTRHLQYRCKICPDGVGGFADIVFADAWHCDDKGYPLFAEEEGRSLIVTRTEKGEAILNEALEVGKISASPLGVDEIRAMQPGQVKRKTLALSRLLALHVLLRPAPRFKGFQLAKAARLGGILANLKSFLGSGRRIILNRR